MKNTHHKKRHVVRNLFFVGGGLFLVIVGFIFIWLSTLPLPDFESFENRKVAKSTKIYDRTGEVLLYNLNQDYRRTVITSEEMGAYIKNATIAIEDKEFYNHNGFRAKSFIRAVLVNLTTGQFSQGGSTITQQIVKNSLLTQDKTITRKIKEIVLSLRVERVLTKDEILTAYLNDSPYGGNIYGVSEAALAYFGKKPADMTLAEAAYIAAIPQAPTRYSPFGSHRDELDARKNEVLFEMRSMSTITNEEYEKARAEVVEFKKEENRSIKAPHFVFFVKEYLVEKYGEEALENGGFSVITTLDYNLQQKAETIVKEGALANEAKYKASNAGMVAIDPKTGHILVMVGSRDYFDKAIDGNYNIATAKRQPGSSFKPFVYGRALQEGYTPDTILIDAPTEFNPSCTAYGQPNKNTNPCYMPRNFTGANYGAMTLRQSLARSINVTAVKALYLVGVRDAIKFAEDVGIKTLTTPDRYGLSLVLGGGEVRLLDMTSAYGVFANAGVRNPATPVLKVTNDKGEVLEEYTQSGEQAIPKQVALQLSDILSDKAARYGVFQPGNNMEFANYQVAAKTGTSNDYRDGWIIGYTPSIVVGVWVGNNDNSEMNPTSSVSTSGPIWRKFMMEVLPKFGNEEFEKPQPEPEDLKPVLRGKWQGGTTYTIDTVSGLLATELTPPETRKEIVEGGVHDILYWLDKNDPRGPAPENPYNDPQFSHWEIAVQNKLGGSGDAPTGPKPTEYDNVHVPENIPQVRIETPNNGDYKNTDTVEVKISVSSNYPMLRTDYFLNDSFIGSTNGSSKTFTFIPENISSVSDMNEIRAVVYDTIYNRGQDTARFSLSD